MTHTVGALVELRIEDLTVDGGGLSRLAAQADEDGQAGEAGQAGEDGQAGQAHSGGRVVFTDRGLPGEIVRARLESVNARFSRAVVVETVCASPHAAPVHCAYALPKDPPGDPADGGEGRPACGGCSWPGLDYAAETAWKENHLRQTLRRVGGVSRDLLEDPAVFEPLLPSPETLRYRNKMEFAFAPGPDMHGAATPSHAMPSQVRPSHVMPSHVMLGLRARASHAVLEVADCPLAGFAAAPVLRLVREWALREKLTAWGNAPALKDAPALKSVPSGKKAPGTGKNAGRGFLRYLVLRRSPAGGCVAELVTGPCAPSSHLHGAVSRLADILCPAHMERSERPESPERPERPERPESPESPCAGFVHSVRAANTAVAYGEEILLQRGVTVMEETLAGLTLRAPVPAFLQVNAGAASRVYETVRDYAALALRNWRNRLNRETSMRHGGIVDAYCGVGGLGILVAGLAEGSEAEDVPLLGLENDRTAVLAARENAARSGVVSAVFKVGDVADLLAALDTPPALVLADPPRSGLSPAVCRELLRLGPESVILVSCNPATLARDVAALSGSYRLAKVRGADLFPHTPHMESVVLLEKQA